jgi:hypothetical protein
MMSSLFGQSLSGQQQEKNSDELLVEKYEVEQTSYWLLCMVPMAGIVCDDTYDVDGLQCYPRG